MGKWVYMSDSGPWSGCGCLIMIVVGLLLLESCESKGAATMPNNSLQRKATGGQPSAELRVSPSR